MSHVERIAWLLLACTLGLGVASVVAVVSQSFVACPDEAALGDQYKEAFSALVDIVKWGIGIASGVVGLLGLQALRVKEGPQYSRAGHLLLEEQPEECASTILDFLREMAAVPAGIDGAS